MTELVPDYDNRLAYGIGLVFHPFGVAVITLLMVLRDIPVEESIRWTLLIAAILFVPLMVSLGLLRRQGQYVYQRRSRGTLYRVGWVSILVILLITVRFDAPKVLTVCMAALLVWVPLQSGINRWITKVSTHTAVVTGCVMGLLLLGQLDTFLLWGLAIMIIALTAWARVMTKNHTRLQVAMGIVTGGLPVLVTFPLLMR